MQKQESGNRLLLFATQLPALPQAVIRLLEVCNDPDTDILRVGRIVAQDVTITAKILKLANSAFLGARSTFINIEQAVIYLGIDSVRNLAISVAVHETFKDRTGTPNQALEEFWHHSLLTALLAKEIAERSGCASPTESYLAGFLHDIGKYLLSICFGEEYEKILETYAGNPELLQQERQAVGITHAEAGARLIQHWNLNPSLARAIAQHHFPPADLPDDQMLSRITALANLLAGNHFDRQSLIKQAAKQLQSTYEELTAIRSNQLERVQGFAESLGIAVPAARQLTEQSEPAAQNRDTLRKKVQSLAQVSGLLDNLIRAKTLNRAFLVLEESLQILFEIDKCILLLPDERNTLLAAHGSFRNRVARRLKGLQIAPAEAAFRIGQALRDCKTIHIEKKGNNTPDEIETLLFDAFAEDALFAVPFTIKETQRGVLLLAATGESAHSFAGIEGSILLLSSHIGSRLCLESIKNRQAEALARERTAAIETIARTLAHEIANPLAIIQNYLSLLGMGDNRSQTMREDLGIIGGELDRIGRISRQLNDLSTPPQPNGRELTDMHALIGETLHLFKQSALLSKNVSLEYSGDPKTPRIWTSPGCLRQILINLLSNSLDAVGTNDRIRVESRFQPASETAENDRIIITVADNGPGIAPAIADHLFRAGHSTKGDGHVGLGLAIVKKLVTDLKGKICHTTGKTGETHFIVDLPAAPEQLA